MRGEEPPATVLVTNGAHGSAVAIIRALGRRGYRVVASESSPRAAGFASRYAVETLVYPSAEEHPRECVRALLMGARRLGVDIIVPVSDAVILPLSEAREDFAGVCRLAIPEREMLAAVTDKHETLSLAARLGVPYPRTHLVRTADEAMDAAPGIGWPLVLKPQASRHLRQQVESYGVTYADGPDRLRHQMEALQGRCPVLLQEYYPGEGHGVELLLHQGRPLAAFQHRRLREVPVTGGASAFRESVPLDPVLYDHAVRLLQDLSWTGLAMVEFKLGAAGPKLMEINGRVWGSLPLAVASGMDFPSRLVQLILHGPPPTAEPPSTEYRHGVRGRNLELDLIWIANVLARRRRYRFLSMPPAKSGLRALLQLLDPACKFDILSLNDPRPGFREMAGLLGRLHGKYRNRVKGL
jgi:predicted ATP-grasp superfamily ATP-dependent carboligase